MLIFAVAVSLFAVYVIAELSIRSNSTAPKAAAKKMKTPPKETSDNTTDPQTVKALLFFGSVAVFLVIWFVFLMDLFGGFEKYDPNSDKAIYEEAMDLAFDGNYTRALQKLAILENPSYKDAENLRALCNAEKYLYQKDYENAWNSYMEIGHIRGTTYIQSAYLDKLRKDIENLPIALYSERIEKEKASGFQDTLMDKIPYVGLAEYWVCSTSLGNHCVKISSTRPGYKGYYTCYRFYNSEGLYIYDVYVDDHEVVDVIDTSSQGKYRVCSSETSEAEAYPYNDYSDFEDFLDDWGDDIGDDNEAERLYYEYHD